MYFGHGGGCLKCHQMVNGVNIILITKVVILIYIQMHKEKNMSNQSKKASAYLMISFLMLCSCQSPQVSDLELLKSSVPTYDSSVLDNLENLNDKKRPQLGKNPENAIVPLLFKKDGGLYTIAEVNSKTHDPEKDITIFVSMPDYQNFITKNTKRGEAFSEKVPYAKAKHAHLFGDPQFNFYIFDAFQIKYEEKRG